MVCSSLQCSSSNQKNFSYLKLRNIFHLLLNQAGSVAIIGVVILFSIMSNPSSLYADEEETELKKLENKIEDYQSKVEDAKSKQQTLSSTIELHNNQIYLSTIKINKTKTDITTLEDQVQDLTNKIDFLEDNLVLTSELLNQRIAATYKRSFIPPIFLLFTVENFAEFFSRIKYLETVQKNDKEVMFVMEETKISFNQQKNLKETKQLELVELKTALEGQNNQLKVQKSIKENLLLVTKNDEQKFQQLLSQARAEYESIQAIIARRGKETQVGDISKGSKIASVISGASCNSSGSHLHFTVVNGDGNSVNPFSYLKSVDHDNCSGPGACSEGDSFNPSGSWDWPVSPKIKYVQGFGSTWAINNSWIGGIYSFHNGIDISGTSRDVRAVADGVLSRGSYVGSNGCNLRYVRLEHNGSQIESLYLHVNY